VRRLAHVVLFVFAWLAFAGLVLAFLPGCAHAPTGATSPAATVEPYIVEAPIGDYIGDWFGDRGPKILGVRNPVDAPVHVIVACPSSSSTGDGFDRWEVDVDANDEVNVLMQQGARDSFVQVCERESWYRIEAPTS
jgi:hypothetical protein